MANDYWKTKSYQPFCHYRMEMFFSIQNWSTQNRLELQGILYPYLYTDRVYSLNKVIGLQSLYQILCVCVVGDVKITEFDACYY